MIYKHEYFVECLYNIRQLNWIGHTSKWILARFGSWVSIHLHEICSNPSQKTFILYWPSRGVDVSQSIRSFSWLPKSRLNDCGVHSPGVNWLWQLDTMTGRERRHSNWNILIFAALFGLCNRRYRALSSRELSSGMLSTNKSVISVICRLQCNHTKICIICRLQCNIILPMKSSKYAL